MIWHEKMKTKHFFLLTFNMKKKMNKNFMDVHQFALFILIHVITWITYMTGTRIDLIIYYQYILTRSLGLKKEILKKEKKCDK